VTAGQCRALCGSSRTWIAQPTRLAACKLTAKLPIHKNPDEFIPYKSQQRTVLAYEARCGKLEADSKTEGCAQAQSYIKIGKVTLAKRTLHPSTSTGGPSKLRFFNVDIFDTLHYIDNAPTLLRPCEEFFLRSTVGE